MKRKIVLATLLGIALATAGVSNAFANWASIHVPHAGNIYQAHSSDHTWDPAGSENGCDDYWSEWYSVPEEALENLDTNASNLVTDTAIVWNGGLDGRRNCNDRFCTVQLCNTDAWGADPWSVVIGPWAITMGSH
jgi:hypothetical protein